MSNLVKLVGRNIKEIRKSKKMTQDQLAEKCGLQTSYLVGVERGDRNITLQTLEKIVEGLDETPSSVFDFESLNIDKQYYNKKELIMLLTELLSSKSEAEIRLILGITQEIYKTYKEK